MDPVNSPHCRPAVGDDCTRERCHWRCAVEVIDELLSSRAAVSGEEADKLLDLRWHLRQGASAEAALRIFCELRLIMERRHYLAFFRIRRWLENHVVASVRICQAAEPHIVPLGLNHYCVEAIRRVCLCSALVTSGVLLAPRLEFEFRNISAPLRRPVIFQK